MPNTITRIITLFTGRHVGDDLLGNRYFENKKQQKLNGRTRRWIVYKNQDRNNKDQARNIPPLCHAWLHHTIDEFPSQEAQKINTPTNDYTPPGSIKTPAERPKAIGDYHAWKP